MEPTHDSALSPSRYAGAAPRRLCPSSPPGTFVVVRDGPRTGVGSLGVPIVSPFLSRPPSTSRGRGGNGGST